MPRRPIIDRKRCHPLPQFAAFTLVELLVVMAIIGVLLTLLVPAMNPLKSAGGVTAGTYDVSGAIQLARSYAIGNNTYTWLGFYEEDAGTLTATAAKPPYTGKGRIVMAIVSAKDGTTSCEDPSASSSNPIALTATKIAQVGKLIKVENVHMTDIGAPAGGNDKTLDGRPNTPYTFGVPQDYLNRISSDDSHASTNATRYPFVAQGYTFWKTLMFTPRGEAIINATYTMKRLAEIGLVPTHGTSVDTANKNVTAIQFTGVGGNVKIYRR